jgi:hypothetical protein
LIDWGLKLALLGIGIRIVMQLSSQEEAVRQANEMHFRGLQMNAAVQQRLAEQQQQQHSQQPMRVPIGGFDSVNAPRPPPPPPASGPIDARAAERAAAGAQ